MAPNRYFLLLAHLLITVAAAGQSKLNLRLKKKLDNIEIPNPLHRSMLKSQELDADSEFDPLLLQRMSQTDSANIKRIAKIIRQVGYPGKTMVGTSTNEVALDVIEHSNRIPQYLPLIKEMASRGEVPFYRYALMLDRQLMHEGKEQFYGTQIRSFWITDPKTGMYEVVSFVWPIQDAAHVNARREKAGFNSTVEAYAERRSIDYKPMTLAEAQKIEAASKAQP